MTYLVSGGYAMWAVLFCGLISIGLAIRAILRRNRAGALLDGALFWGSAALTVGVIGTLLGVTSLATAMADAGASAGAGLAWQGVRISLSTTVVGSGVFLLSLTCRWILLTRTDERGR